MEGRQPPPPAHHLFPDDPTPINKKFWGTQSMRGFFAFGAVVAVGWMSLIAFNAYLMRNENRILFFKFDPDPENMKKKMAMMAAEGSYGNRMFTGFQTTRLQLFPDKNQPPDYDLRLDDSVKQSIPRMERSNNLRIR